MLQSSAGPITAGINFESSIQGQSGTQQINTVELPDQLDPGETLELTLTVNTPTGTQTVTLSQTLAGDETLQDAAEGLVEDLAELTDGQGNPLGLSGSSFRSPYLVHLVALKALQSPAYRAYRSRRRRART